MPRAKRTAESAPAAERLMNLPEAAEFLRIDADTLRSLTRRGRVPAMKIGRQWRFDPVLLREWVRNESLQRASQSPAREARQEGKCGRAVCLSTDARTHGSGTE